MPVPWLQIVQLVPSIVEVSRELLRKTRRSTPAAADVPNPQSDEPALSARIAVLEENERRQAELVNQMAEQIAVLTRAVTDLHQRGMWLILGATGAASLAIVALVMASQG
jgi:uncharacterized membrane protein YcjF (UPF0283 family)